MEVVAPWRTACRPRRKIRKGLHHPVGGHVAEAEAAQPRGVDDPAVPLAWLARGDDPPELPARLAGGATPRNPPPGSASATTEEDTCLPRPVAGFTSPTARSASGIRAFTSVDFPTPECPTRTLTRSASRSRSRSRTRLRS